MDRKIFRRKRGQTLVEFAVLFPFFLLVIVGGMIDFGMAFYNYSRLQQLVNDVARQAAETGGTDGLNNGEIQTLANSKKPAWWSGNFTVSSEQIQCTGNPQPRPIIRVVMSYDSPAYTPFYQTMFGAISGSPNIHLTSAAAYKIPDLVL